MSGDGEYMIERSKAVAEAKGVLPRLGAALEGVWAVYICVAIPHDKSRTVQITKALSQSVCSNTPVCFCMPLAAHRGTALPAIVLDMCLSSSFAPCVP